MTNEKYKGDALLQKSYTVDFLTKKKKVNEGEIPQYYVEGNHEAIIQPEIFELVQQELERRKNSRGRHSGVHLFSSKIKCGQCGEWYGSKVWHSNSKYRRVIWQCNHKYDGEEKCSTPHLTEDEIKTMFVSAVNKLISNKDAVLAPLRASLDIAFDTSALEAETEELQSEIMVTSDLIQKCICENAHVALDQTEYQKRYDGLTARFDSAKAQLEENDSAIADKKSRRATIEAFMDTLAQADLMEKFDPALWCGLVDFVTVYSKDDVRFTFRNGMEIKSIKYRRINASLLNFVLSVVRHISSQKFIKRVNRDAFLNFNWILGAFINCFFRQNESIFLLAFEENIFTKQHSVGIFRRK